MYEKTDMYRITTGACRKASGRQRGRRRHTFDGAPGSRYNGRKSHRKRVIRLGEKDIGEKILADYNDVFADVMNVLLFHGRQVVSPDDLENIKDKSQYKVDGRLHEQERDVAKYVRSGKLTVVMAGFEHQTEPEEFMPLRVIGYDGAAYRAQLLNKQRKRVCPVVTLVLYFGDKKWPFSPHLTDALDISEAYQPYVSDYRINLFQIAFLSEEQVRQFQSDFRYVADYFVQRRLYGAKNYKPKPETIRHVDAVLKLMSVLTGDRLFEKSIPVLSEKEKKGGVTMCDVLEYVESEGAKKVQRESVVRMLRDGELSKTKIARYLGLTVDEVDRIEQEEMKTV